MFGPLTIDWGKLFLPQTPILEIFLRGTVVYLALFTLLRIVLKRESGSLAMTDLLVVVLLADAAQNAMAGQYTTITDGLLLVTTIVGWSYVLNWLGFRFAWFRRFVHPPPLLLVKDGRLIRRNMQRELITREELISQLREQGVESVEDVREAYMEGDGRISVVERDKEQHPRPERRSS